MVLRSVSNDSLPMDDYCPVNKTLLGPPLNTIKRTTIHTLLSLFMLRHTSIHSYDIPEETNTGARCARSVQQNVAGHVPQAERECQPTLFLAIWRSTYKHTDALPMLLCTRTFRLFMSQPLPAVLRTRIMTDRYTVEQEQANGNVMQRVCYVCMYWVFTYSFMWLNIFGYRF